MEPTPGQEEGQLQGGGQPWPRAWGTPGMDEVGDRAGGRRTALWPWQSAGVEVLEGNRGLRG